LTFKDTPDIIGSDKNLSGSVGSKNQLSKFKGSIRSNQSAGGTPTMLKIALRLKKFTDTKRLIGTKSESSFLKSNLVNSNEIEIVKVQSKELVTQENEIKINTESNTKIREVSELSNKSSSIKKEDSPVNFELDDFSYDLNTSIFIRLVFKKRVEDLKFHSFLSSIKKIMKHFDSLYKTKSFKIMPKAYYFSTCKV
jgi:hypothetical protein